MIISVPADVAALCDLHGIDPSAVALAAVADAIEAAVLSAAREAENTARVAALAAVADVLDPLRGGDARGDEPDPGDGKART